MRSLYLPPSTALRLTPRKQILFKHLPKRLLHNLLSPPRPKLQRRRGYPPPATPVSVLGRGGKNDEVKALQEKLIELGYFKEGQADSVFGRDTEKAVEAFQKRIAWKQMALQEKKH